MKKISRETIDIAIEALKNFNPELEINEKQRNNAIEEIQHYGLDKEIVMAKVEIYESVCPDCGHLNFHRFLGTMECKRCDCKYETKEVLE